MSDSELSSMGSEPSSPAPAAAQTSPEKPTGNRYDTMFGSDHESDAVPAEHSDSDEDAVVRKRSRKEAGHEDEDDAGSAAGGDDLFGDDSGNEAPTKPRELTDRELSRTPSPSPPRSPERFIEVNLPHHPGPEPGSSDSHLYLLKLPSFLSLEPVLFEPHTFTLPTLPADSSVSPYTAATTTIRTRRDPTTKDTLQSNSRIIRWSDGTLSLQVASTPNLYDLPAKALCPDPNNEDAYDPAQDSHTYLLDPHESATMLRVVARATKSLKCVSASASLVADQSIVRLNNEFAAALSARTGRSNQLEITAMKDPEAERKEAERIAKEKERAAKKIEAQQRRQRERDPLGMESAARRAYQKVTGTRSKRDSPPITSGRRMGREDEYDLEDEFIEGSEDEEEEAEESEEERRPRRESERDRKRRRVVEDDDDSE